MTWLQVTDNSLPKDYPHPDDHAKEIVQDYEHYYNIIINTWKTEGYPSVIFLGVEELVVFLLQRIACVQRELTSWF